MTVCVRCSGRKRMYKRGAGYSLTNTGGLNVPCPLCLGTGEMPTLSDIDALKHKAASKKGHATDDARRRKTPKKEKNGSRRDTKS